jgi:hypothetical protein
MHREHESLRGRPRWASALTLAVTASIGVGLTVAVVVAAGPASAATSSFAWGPNSQVVFNNGADHKGKTILKSADGAERLFLGPRGDLRMQKHFNCGYNPCGEFPTGVPGNGWFSYWRSNTTGTLGTYYFIAGAQGRLRVTDHSLKTLWSSSAAPGTQYKYGLELGTLGRVREWYSTGNPFGTGRKLAWQINRDVGERTICQGLPLNQSGTTEANPNLQVDTDIAVTIYNKNIFGLAVTVYRYYNGGEVHPPGLRHRPVEQPHLHRTLVRGPTHPDDDECADAHRKSRHQQRRVLQDQGMVLVPPLIAM